ncbi:DUF58 domain-containing protein [Shewanella salipaludis]|nr:DUF58 domain-containing protein [Shewanella salipaludis]
MMESTSAQRTGQTATNRHQAPGKHRRHGAWALRRWFGDRWQLWLARRLPPGPKITLDHSRIFILPSGFGLLWLLLVLVLYLFGTNYQNNLVIGLSILLFSLFNTCIIYSYRNLAGLTLASLPPPQVYAGDTLTFPIHLSSSHSSHELYLRFGANAAHRVPGVTREKVLARVTLVHPRRGPVQPGRLTLASNYPLGLCRAWSHVDLALHHLVFAAPRSQALQLERRQDSDDKSLTQGKSTMGVNEFKGLKSYVIGESLKHVAWKQWAQGRGMLSKEFHQLQGVPLWLELGPLAPNGLEQRLSELAWQVDRLTADGQRFGLSLGQQRFGPGEGAAHRLLCQRAIALYPSDSQDSASAPGSGPGATP